MKQNITISLDKEIIKKGKVIAAMKESSISKMLGDTLKRIVQEEEAYVASKRRALQYLKKGFHMGEKITWNREDLYE